MNINQVLLGRWRRHETGHPVTICGQRVVQLRPSLNHGPTGRPDVPSAFQASSQPLWFVALYILMRSHPNNNVGPITDQCIGNLKFPGTEIPTKDTVRGWQLPIEITG